jgi:Zn finger protein HypA/HybF involved in hydrogenase expression
MSKNNKWTDEEISFLKENYQNKGVKYVCDNLFKHTKNSIVKKAMNLGLKVDVSIYNYDYEKIIKIVKESYNYKDVLRKLNKSSSGNAYTYLIRYIKKRNIDVSHFNSYKNNHGTFKKFSLKEIFVENSEYKGGTKELKKIILKNNLIEYKCVNCNNIGEWDNKFLSLHLDHINGNNKDDRLENLRFLCPNCHSQTTTYSGKNRHTHSYSG